MKVRISYTVDVDPRFRRAINNHYGEKGLATRADVKEWFKRYGESANHDIMFDLDHVDEEVDESALEGR